MSQSDYYFPSFRRGAGASIRATGGKGEKRAQVPVRISVNATTGEEKDFVQQVSLYGPGDILGFNSSVVRRARPTSDDPNFPPTFIPYIEFDDPDFLWRYSALKVKNTWIPWLTLIILKDEEGDGTGEYDLDTTRYEGLPERMKLRATGLLPDLKSSWRWAHVGCQDTPGMGSTQKGRQQLLHNIANRANYAYSRLLCARKLSPGKKYTAFVVPVYKLGVEAALGLGNTDSDRTMLAWKGRGQSRDLPLQMGLPYYYKWSFRTGQRGDLEDLIRRIKPFQAG